MIRQKEIENFKQIENCIVGCWMEKDNHIDV